MSKKSLKIARLMDELTAESGGRFDPHYLGYFECFNRQMYYEAHDVLEELWLHKKGDPLFPYYKGLIQLAGAFVHLEKSRLNPAARLFRLALKNFEPYMPYSEGLDVNELTARIRKWLKDLDDSNYTKNPYNSKQPPKLTL